jgi:hypothetical protein
VERGSASRAHGRDAARGRAGARGRERESLLAWLDAALGADEPAGESGVAVMRRLNRREYAHTIRDLFGVAIEANELPADEVGQGFDTIGAVLATSELLVETHLRWPSAWPSAPFCCPIRPNRVRTHVDGAQLSQGESSHPRGSTACSTSRARSRSSHAQPRAGDYVLRVRAHGDQAGDEPCRLAIKAASREVLRADVPRRNPTDASSRSTCRCLPDRRGSRSRS